MDPLYNNNPNPAPVTPPKVPAPNAMPNIAVAGSQPTPAPTPNPLPPAPNPLPPTPNPLPPAPAPAPTPQMEETPAPTMSFDKAFETEPTVAAEPLAKPAEETPDPFEAAFDEPIQAAGPVPGSIGSAFSVPNEPTPADMGASVPTTPNNNVAFNTEPSAYPFGDDTIQIKSSDIENKKKTFIIIAVAAVLAIVLIIVLIVMLLPKPSSQSSGGQSSNPTPNVVEVPVAKTVSCKYILEEDGLAFYDNATSGYITVEMNFNEDDTMVDYAQEYVLKYADADAADAAGENIRASIEAEVAGYELTTDPFTTSYSSGSADFSLTRSVVIDEDNIDVLPNFGVDINSDASTSAADYESIGYICSIK